MLRNRVKKIDHAKQNGVHYTPPELAQFLAEATWAAVQTAGKIRALDPACGNGGLLVAIANAVSESVRSRMILEGFETDSRELAKADGTLGKLGVGEIRLHNSDFLLEAGISEFGRPRGLFDEPAASQKYDIVIANPPYVRTQVLGAEKAQALARQFGLTGRVDLYHAFAMGMMAVLKPGGVLGLLTSNRFLTVRSGASMRQMLSSQFEIEAIYDLGDTKLFTAAVLPVIVVARKGMAKSGRRKYHRIYEHRNATIEASVRRSSILAAIRDEAVLGVIETPEGTFHIERGRLALQADVWTLSNPELSGWLATVEQRQVKTFGDLTQVRVGIKSTADEVFVRSDWGSLPAEIQPEAELLRPLLTHREAARWTPAVARKKIIYPHTVKRGKRCPIELSKFPKAANYFERHRERLTGRSYVIEGGREWYEIWVPHNPDDWARPKIAYPDISEHPRFFFDASGAVIQGDCYWMTLNPGEESDWLPLILAVANSTFITKYYDAVFHNKLYAGRRRFMTQYVSKFPLPDLKSLICRRIVDSVTDVLKRGAATPGEEQAINRLVWNAFGLQEEIPWQADL